MARLAYEIPFPTSQESVKTWAEAQSKQPPTDDNFRFQIENIAGELVGTLNTHNCNPRNGTFSYGVAVRSEHQRKGYAAEAIRLVLRYYFEERRYQKVTVEVYSFNAPSIRLHEALGFTLEGRLRRMHYAGGAYHDVLVYGLTREEFKL
jgi:RimJ/RimL family protein N-acetyltransferase